MPVSKALKTVEKKLACIVNKIKHRMRVEQGVKSRLHQFMRLLTTS